MICDKNSFSMKKDTITEPPKYNELNNPPTSDKKFMRE
jgi:hypothetical protein